jgi:hypothetical protein
MMKNRRVAKTRAPFLLSPSLYFSLDIMVSGLIRFPASVKALQRVFRASPCVINTNAESRCRMEKTGKIVAKGDPEDVVEGAEEREWRDILKG